MNQKEQFTFRKYRKSDHQALTAIIRKTWHYDKFASPKTAEKMARVFLNSCLANQTFTEVALCNDRPVGIIMCKNIRAHKCSLRLWLNRTLSIASLLLTKEGRAVSKIFGSVNGIDQELLESCPQNFQGEIAFFAIDSAYRGKGLGKKLFQSALSYMKAERLRNFYLFTDTSCNYKFYEHQGLSRCRERKHTFQVQGQAEEMTFFIYSY